MLEQTHVYSLVFEEKVEKKSGKEQPVHQEMNKRAVTQRPKEGRPSKKEGLVVSNAADGRCRLKS